MWEKSTDLRETRAVLRSRNMRATALRLDANTIARAQSRFILDPPVSHEV